MRDSYILRQKIISALEIFLFLFALPYFMIGEHEYFLRRILLILGGIYAVWRLCGKISWKFLFCQPCRGWWKGPLLRSAVIYILSFIFIIVFEPQNLFGLPREYPFIWLVIAVCYPVFSVLPQELIYRVYLCEVHKDLLASPRVFIIISSLCFAWLHIVFAGWFAVGTTFFVGLVLSFSYIKNRSTQGAIWPLILEHFLYGFGVVSLGLESHFYVPR